MLADTTTITTGGCNRFVELFTTPLAHEHLTEQFLYPGASLSANQSSYT